MNFSTRKVTFEPRARLVSILGEQMISDSVVGLIELVKNSYDADASHVTITLNGLSDTSTACVTVVDDGFGMTAGDVIDRFLAPASDYKARAKERSERTPRFGRLPIGEKGVGRFAIQQLGRQFVLITRAANALEVVVHIDWDAFDRPDARLSDITFEVLEREPELFTDDKSGTSLMLTTAREHWDRAKVAKLQKGLRRLRSPHVGEGKQGFDICLRCPEFPELENLDQGDLRANYHYRFMALVDAHGMLEFEYLARHPAMKIREVFSESQVDLAVDVQSELDRTKPTCGSFLLNLYVWDRTASYLKASGVSRAELDDVAGVSLFRDKLRVLPYGEPGDDWLFLDRGRINNPSERIGNNQVLGYVEIDQQSAGGLKDKTNREGLIDNAAFRDLRVMVRAAIRYFETLWRDDRPIQRATTATTEPLPVTKSLNRARAITNAIADSASPDISVSINNTANSPIMSAAKQCRLVTQLEAASEAATEIEFALAAQKQIEARQAEERELLLHLAATGLAAERLIHEVGRQSVAVLSAVEDLQSGDFSSEALAVIQSAVGTLRNEFRSLSPEGGVTRFQKRREVWLREAVKIARRLNQHLFDDLGKRLVVTGDDFMVYSRPSSVVQILDNLLHNALMWSKSEIVIDIDANNMRVTVQDDGPGIKIARPEAIFEPHVTTRPDGHGLGLYIVRELVQHDGGRINLGIGHNGACFKVDFSGYPAKPVKGQNNER